MRTVPSSEPEYIHLLSFWNPTCTAEGWFVGLQGLHHAGRPVTATRHRNAKVGRSQVGKGPDTLRQGVTQGWQTLTRLTGHTCPSCSTSLQRVYKRPAPLSDIVSHR